jgi:UDP:flavonoid glycosyltransferase YjiC (YdhE family)
MRVLLTWELGLNLGHLTRLLPVVQRLREEGHVVLVAARDVRAAATVLGPAEIPFVQAPHLPNGIPLAHRPSGYADILLSQGWSSRSALWGLTHGWLNIFKLFRPDQLVLDYSPTVSLAARIAKIQTVIIGNGFELPPLFDPMPEFPGFSWATPEGAARSEKIAVGTAETVLRAFKQPAVASLRDFMIDQVCLLATLPELDHYGIRKNEEYVGPLLGSLSSSKVGWPSGSGPKIFACLRPDTIYVNEILMSLGAITARVVCVASGFTRAQLQPFRRDHIVFSSAPVDLKSLSDADLCVTYGAEGTIMKFLIEGVPQLVSPWHVEAHLAARRIESLGAAKALKGPIKSDAISIIISEMCANTEYKMAAQRISERFEHYDAETALERVAKHFDKATVQSRIQRAAIVPASAVTLQ